MANNMLNLLVKFTGIDNLSSAMKNIITGSKTSAGAMRELRQSSRDLERELKQVRREMEAAGQDHSLAARERELSERLERTNHELGRRERHLERVSRLESRAGRASELAGKAGAVATVTMTAPLIAFGREAFLAATDAAELDSAFNVTFGKNAPMMDAWATKTGDALSRTSTEMKQAANTFGIFFNQADPKKSAALSQQFAVLAQDLSSFYNVDPGEALAKLRSGLTGESEPLRDFGVFMTDATVKAQALKMGLKPVNGELTEQQKIMARAGLIMASTTAAQGDLIRTSSGTANQLRAADTAWQNLTLTVGKELIPALTPAITTFTGIIKSFSTLSPETRKWIVILGVGAAVLGPFLLGIAGLASGIGSLAPLIVGLGGASAAGAAGVGAAGVAAGGAATGFGALVVAALPVIAVVALIAGAAYLIYRNWTPISSFFGNLWASITGYFTTNWTTIRNVALGGFVIFAPMLAGVVLLASVIYRSWSGISAATMAMVNRVAGIVGPFLRPFIVIHGYLQGLVGKFFGFGVNIVGGLIRGIVSMTGSVIKAIINLAGAVGGKFAALLGIKSPSRLFMEMGGHINEGLGIGLERGQRRPVDAVGRMASAVAGAGALALAPAAPARTPPPSGPAKVEIHIHQQPGESPDELAERVARIFKRGGPGAGGGSDYGDDF